MSRIIVVSGTRRHSPDLRILVYNTLDAIRESKVYLFHGGQTGADELADSWALKCNWQPYPFAYPRFDGKRGGPARNIAFCAAAAAMAHELQCRIDGFTFPDAQSVGTYRAEEAMTRYSIPWTRHPVVTAASAPKPHR